MANLNETATWEAGIYQWETSDPVQGGPNGIDNKPTRQLANRTLWLKTEIAKAVASIGKNKTDAENIFARKSTTVTAGAGLTGGGTLGGNMQFALGTPGTCSGNTTNWAGSDTHTHQLAAASPTVAGVAKLINNLTTDDADSALSAKMGKKLQDEKLGKEGNQEISGSTFTVGGRSYPGYRLWSTSGTEGLLIESSGINTGHKLIVRRHNNGNFESSNIRSFALPNINGDYTLAPAGLLTNHDLNTITVAGLYGQNSNTNAQLARNYPVVKAGSLLVLPSAYGVQQIYSVFDSTDIYARNQNSGGWTAWQKTNVSPAEMQAAIAAALPEKSDAVDLDDSTKLATAKAVKTLHDKIANAVPSGSVLHFDLPTAPPGWYELNGAAVPVSACPGLVAARYVGNSANATADAYYKCTNPSNPNGSRNVNGTHIKLPDHRGEFLRAWDHGRGVDAGRQLGSAQGDAIRNIKGQFQADDEVGVVTRSFGNDLMGAFRSERNHSNGKGHDSNGGGGDIVSFDASRVVPTASENRPRNFALMLCIKA